MISALRRKHRNRLYRIRITEVNSVLAHAASLVLTGVPPAVCESVLSDLYSTVRKSLNNILH